MNVLYETPYWLNRRWTKQALTALTEAQIQSKQAEIDAAVSKNQRLHQSAQTSLEQERTRFRQIHPRNGFPRDLKSIEQPPNIEGQWKNLLYRREDEFRRVERADEQKREVFLSRMYEGRFQAMQRRERAIRKMIDDQAIKAGVRLTGRAIDTRLSELLEYLNGKAES